MRELPFVLDAQQQKLLAPELAEYQRLHNELEQSRLRVGRLVSMAAGQEAVVLDVSTMTVRAAAPDDRPFPAPPPAEPRESQQSTPAES